nr:immunoglobulin light chain junction region [Macaca mulatta]MOX79703.1 immunoglobulin light chain junction region [Macaca mulatta]MOX79874.1 immunoglobulin light chain junction region [Macaca mulatta]MOX82059.1 immunoglobulin light chain junction region [Macaca mulatta]MOX82420.1 immunoglobulin light chain junction region [Macaca mulatta]
DYYCATWDTSLSTGLF